MGPDFRKVAEAALKDRRKNAGEVRFIKDRGGDKDQWAWGTPGPSQRDIDEEFVFKPRYLKPLARSLRSALMALGHATSSYNTFAKLKSRDISPDGNLGGKGYIQKISDMRRQMTNCIEALSAFTDTIYDELNAPHWSPEEDALDPRDRDEVKEIVEDAEEIRQDPGAWAEEEEQEEEEEAESENIGQAKLAGRGALPAGQYWVVPFRNGRPDAPDVAPSVRHAVQRAKTFSKLPGVDYIEIRDGLDNLFAVVQDGHLKTASATAERVTRAYLWRRTR